MAESFVEQLARLRAARVSIDGLPKQYPPHPVAGELERPFVCNGCGRTILVGPCFEHIDAATFVGMECCYERLGGVVVQFPTDTTSDAATTTGTVGNARGVGA